METAHTLLGCIVVPVQAALEMIYLIPWQMPSGASLPVSLCITAMEDLTIMEAHLHGNQSSSQDGLSQAEGQRVYVCHQLPSLKLPQVGFDYALLVFISFTLKQLCNHVVYQTRCLDKFIFFFQMLVCAQKTVKFFKSRHFYYKEPCSKPIFHHEQMTL